MKYKSRVWVWQGGQVVLFSYESFGDTTQQLSGWSSCRLCIERGEWYDLVQEIDVMEKMGIFIPQSCRTAIVFWVALTSAGNNGESDSLELLHLGDPESWTVVGQTLLYLFLEI